MVLKHFMVYNPPNPHLQKSLAIISVQITTHSLLFTVTCSGCSPSYSLWTHWILWPCKRVTKSSQHIPISFREAPSTEMNAVSPMYHQLRSLSPVQQMQNTTSLSFPFEEGRLSIAGRLRWLETRH